MKKAWERVRTLKVAPRMASGPAAIGSNNEASVRRKRERVCMMASGWYGLSVVWSNWMYPLFKKGEY